MRDDFPLHDGPGSFEYSIISSFMSSTDEQLQYSTAWDLDVGLKQFLE